MEIIIVHDVKSLPKQYSLFRGSLEAAKKVHSNSRIIYHFVSPVLSWWQFIAVPYEKEETHENPDLVVSNI